MVSDSYTHTYGSLEWHRICWQLPALAQPGDAHQPAPSLSTLHYLNLLRLSFCGQLQCPPQVLLMKTMISASLLHALCQQTKLRRTRRWKPENVSCEPLSDLSHQQRDLLLPAHISSSRRVAPMNQPALLAWIWSA
jgi:hypothetical protein